MSTASTPAPVLAFGIHTPPITPKFTMVQIPASRSTTDFALDNATDDELNSMDETQLRQIILNARPFSNPASGVPTPSVNLLPSSFASHHFYYQNISSPQIGCLRRSDNISWFPRFPR